MKFKVIASFFVLVFASIYVAEGFLFRNYNEDEFQVATAYLKDCRETLFSSDFIWSKPEMIRNLHVCVRQLMHATDLLSFHTISEPIDLFLLWLPICFTLFFVGNYLLAFHFTQDRWASFLVACAFMLARRSIGDWWGIGQTFTMSARGLVLSLLPLIFWAYIRSETSPKKTTLDQNVQAKTDKGRLIYLGIIFFFWGLISNFHPLSGWGFVELLGVTILFSERFQIQAWRKVIVMGIATILGSIPFLIIWHQVIHVPTSFKPNPLLAKQLLNYYQLVQPSTGKYLIQLLQDIAIPLLLAIGGFFLWRHKHLSKESKLMRTISYFPWITIGMTILVIISGYILRYQRITVPVMITEHSRNIKMVYLTLPIWMGIALAYWIQNSKRPILKWGTPILIIFISIAINFPGHKLARYIAYKANYLPKSAIEKFETNIRNDAADVEVARWARKNTSNEALFYFDSYEFRYYARRSLVFCSFDRPCVSYRPTKEMEEWAERSEQTVPLKKTQNTSAMFALAQKYHANFLIALNSWEPLDKKPVWSNWKFSIYRIE